MANWSKSAKNDIWLNYINEIIFEYYDKSVYSNWDLRQEAPCSWCGRRMAKAGYIGIQQSESSFSWDVDHIDGNRNNNYLDNLQPMHPRCNKMKGRG